MLHRFSIRFQVGAREETRDCPKPQQRQVIEHTDGHLLVIAGPGSGKTYTLVERVIQLVTSKGVKPENLFVVTFTEKAAKELVTRISNRLFRGLHPGHRGVHGVHGVHGQRTSRSLRAPSLPPRARLSRHKRELQLCRTAGQGGGAEMICYITS